MARQTLAYSSAIPPPRNLRYEVHRRSAVTLVSCKDTRTGLRKFRTLQLAVPALHSCLAFFVDLAALAPTPRPSENLCPFALAHSAEPTEKLAIRKPPLIDQWFRILHGAPKSFPKSAHYCSLPLPSDLH